jgi:hypothetical protein
VFFGKKIVAQENKGSNFFLAADESIPGKD